MATRPNLLILCTDQFRGDCLGARGLNPDIRTPHMDALAGRGVMMADHFCTFPKCVPSRVSLMTGRYCHTDGYRDIHQHLPFGTPDLLSTALAAGYEAALIGHNHCWENLLEASHAPPELAPGRRGLRIDHHSWTAALRPVWDAHKARQLEPPAEFDPHHLGVPNLRTHYDYIGRHRAWADECYVEQAARFFHDVHDRGRPFFLQVNLGKPHTPYEAKEPFFSMYDRASIRPYPRGVPAPTPLAYAAQRRHRTGMSEVADERVLREVQATYYAMCSQVDAQMGEILGSLASAGLAEETVVLLWSDHGDFAGQYGLVEKWDTAFCDGLMHTLCVLAGPGLPRGRRVDALSDSTDLAPTLAQLLGLPAIPGVHGSSLLPVIEGRAPGRTAVFADGGHDASARHAMSLTPDRPGENAKQTTYRREPESMARAQMVRTRTHKLVVRETGDHELYDLINDPFELRNLHGDPASAGTRADLLGRLAEWNLRTLPDRPEITRVGA